MKSKRRCPLIAGICHLFWGSTLCDCFCQHSQISHLPTLPVFGTSRVVYHERDPDPRIFRTSLQAENPHKLDDFSESRGRDHDARGRDVLDSILRLASAHFSSQALHAAIRLRIPDILDERTMPLNDIADALGQKCNKDALLRTLRLLTTVRVLEENVLDDSNRICFSLTELGRQFRSGNDSDLSMASCILHWMERPLWNAWLEIPEYITDGGSSSPFASANDGISSDYWYNEEEQPESLGHANDFVRLIHTHEVDAVVDGINWSVFRDKKLVDIGGHYGNLVAAISDKEPTIDCYCLDLPQVISKASPKDNIVLLPGDIFDPKTIPSCDVILMKHFLDRCMWNDEETIEILRNCHTALNQDGKVIIAEAILPNYGDISDDNALPLYLDALYMLVGRESQRTEVEWRTLADRSSFEIKRILRTHVPSCSLMVLEKV